jgi:hypothetical protein
LAFCHIGTWATVVRRKCQCLIIIKNANLSQRTLREFGLGKATIEQLVQDEVKNLIHNMEADVNVPISVKYTFQTPVISSLWSIISGETLDANDPVMVRFTRALQKVTEDLANILASIAFTSRPLMIIVEALGIITITDMHSANYAIFDKSIKEHKATFNPEQPRDFIDCYLKAAEVFENFRNFSLDSTRGCPFFEK